MNRHVAHRPSVTRPSSTNKTRNHRYRLPAHATNDTAIHTNPSNGILPSNLVKDKIYNTDSNTLTTGDYTNFFPARLISKEQDSNGTVCGWISQIPNTNGVSRRKKILMSNDSQYRFVQVKSPSTNDTSISPPLQLTPSQLTVNKVYNTDIDLLNTGQYAGFFPARLTSKELDETDRQKTIYSWISEKTGAVKRITMSDDPKYKFVRDMSHSVLTKRDRVKYMGGNRKSTKHRKIKRKSRKVQTQ